MLREVCGSNRFTLTENKRSDPSLFDFIQSMRPGTPRARPLAEALEDARARFPRTAREADWVLCLSHRKRMALNRQMNQRRKPPGALFFRHRPASGDLSGNQPQSMWLWQGITLVGAGGPCPKGILVEVTGLTEREGLFEPRRLASPRAGLQVHAPGALPLLRQRAGAHPAGRGPAGGH